jgi:hypothetical protein
MTAAVLGYLVALSEPKADRAAAASCPVGFAPTRCIGDRLAEKTLSEIIAR